MISRSETAEEVSYLDLSNSDPGIPDDQKIKDISALACFPNLDGINLNWNDVTDLTPSDQSEKIGRAGGCLAIRESIISSRWPD